jgi:hypothetical protein
LISRAVSPTHLYNDLSLVIPVKTGIQVSKRLDSGPSPE